VTTTSCARESIISGSFIIPMGSTGTTEVGTGVLSSLSCTWLVANELP
jgi:hypothetical protein